MGPEQRGQSPAVGICEPVGPFRLLEDFLQQQRVYVNTLMLQHVLAEPEWEQLLGPADRRGLTALFWEHVRPYGEVRLNLGNRRAIGDGAAAARERPA